MKALTVKQLAAVSGVTVRALHHYDEIGLLKPATVGANGYRYYGREELLRLQRILLHRELGVPLHAIARLLDLQGAEAIAVLREHRERLRAQYERYRELIETLERTIAALESDRLRCGADLYRGFRPETQAGYEHWLIERYRETMRVAVGAARRAHARRADAEHVALTDELRALETALAEALRRGVAPGADELKDWIARHRAWVAARWGRACSPRQYAGLAQLYRMHPDFVARYEALEPGLTEYLAAAMTQHAVRLGES